MKNTLLILLLSLTTWAAQAQLVTMKGDVAFVNDQPYARIKKEGCKTMQGPCSYEVFTTTGLRVCKAKVMMQPKTDKSDRTPNVYYVQYRFYEPQDATCETPFPLSVTLHPGDVITELARAGVIYEGDIDEEALMDFIDSYGNTFSTGKSMPNSDDRQAQPKKKKKKGEEDEEED